MTPMAPFSLLDRVRGIDTRHKVHEAIDALTEVNQVAREITRVLDKIDNQRGKDT